MLLHVRGERHKPFAIEIIFRQDRAADGRMAELAVYGGLLISAFLAATLLPGSSEALLTGLVVTGRGEPALLLTAATIGNVFGSVANWLCGRFLFGFGIVAGSLFRPVTTIEPLLGTNDTANGLYCSPGCRSWEIR